MLPPCTRRTRGNRAFHGATLRLPQGDRATKRHTVMLLVKPLATCEGTQPDGPAADGPSPVDRYVLAGLDTGMKSSMAVSTITAARPIMRRLADGTASHSSDSLAASVPPRPGAARAASIQKTE